MCQVSKLLLDTDGVDVDLKDNKGRTPLFLAAENGNEAVVWLLLRTNGIDPGRKHQTYHETGAPSYSA